MKKRPTHKVKPVPTAPPAASASLPPAGILGPSVLIPLYTLLIVIGYLLFHSGKGTISGNELSGPRSLFTAMNIATLTGFQQSTNFNDYTAAGKCLAAALTIGGVLFSFIAGGLAVVRIARLNFNDWQVAGAACVTTAAATLIGGACLLHHDDGILATLFNALAFANSGLYSGHLQSADTCACTWSCFRCQSLAASGCPC